MIVASKSRGFTLIEMVVAVVIFAVMMVVAFPGLTHIAKIGNQVGESNHRLAELQFAMTYLNRDWMQVSARKIRNQYGDEEGNIIIQDNSISFTRSGYGNLLQQQRSELQRVKYLMQDDKLLRQHWLSLDQGIAEEPFTTVLLHDIESLELHFIDSSETAIESWPNPLANRAGSPVALQITLIIKQFGEIRRIMEIPEGVL